MWLGGRCGDKLLLRKRMPRRLNIIIGRMRNNLLFFMIRVMIKRKSDMNSDERRINRGIVI